MQKTVQLWLAGLLALGAGYLVLTNASGVASGLKAAQGFVSGTEATALTGKA
jgi:hypothetical protein